MPESVRQFSVAKALEKIDTQSILFFLGILLAVTALQSFGILKTLATFLNSTLKNNYLIGTALGLLSALVDNVPLVAASQGMYDLVDVSYGPSVLGISGINNRNRRQRNHYWIFSRSCGDGHREYQLYLVFEKN